MKKNSDVGNKYRGLKSNVKNVVSIYFTDEEFKKFFMKMPIGSKKGTFAKALIMHGLSIKSKNLKKG